MNKEFLDPNTRYSDQKADLAKMPGLVSELVGELDGLDTRVTALEEGGGGGGNSLILNLTPESPTPGSTVTTFTVDKTSEEIYSALKQNPDCDVLALVGFQTFKATVINMSKYSIEFYKILADTPMGSTIAYLVVSFSEETVATGTMTTIELGGSTQTPLSNIVYRLYKITDETGTVTRITDGGTIDTQVGPVYSLAGTYPRRGREITDPPVNLMLFKDATVNKIEESSSVTLVLGAPNEPTYEYAFDISYFPNNDGFTELYIKLSPQGTDWRVEVKGVQGQS